MDTQPLLNAKTVSMLANPHPKSHLVYPYSDEQRLADAVSIFASTGLAFGEAVILIAVPAHQAPFEQRLTAGGFDVAQLSREGDLVFIDAEEMMAKFMLDGMPDAAIFKTLVASVIERARNSSLGLPRKVRLFGEMVSLLWTKGNVEAALRLEQLWNEVIELYSVPLLCTYSLVNPTSQSFPEELLSAHSHTIHS